MRGAVRRGILLLLTAGLLLSVCGVSFADAQQDAGTKMELPVGSFYELCKQVPDVPLMDAPKGAEDVAYSVVGDMPTIAQIKFVLHERSFCYRAARFSNSSNMPDISGMKNKFDAQMELGGVLYRQDTSTGAGVASWYYESTHSQYSVAIQRAFDPEYMRQVAVAMRSQNGEPIPPEPYAPGTELLGTVTAVSGTKITVKDLKSRQYTFAIDKATVFTSVVVKGSIVRVVYAAPYAENTLARRVELVESAEEKTSAKSVSRATKSGVVLARGPERLQIERPSGSIYTFYTANAAIYGDTWAGVGDSATVSYYVDSYGTKVATKITYRAAYAPIPEPWPCPVPVPIPEPIPTLVPVPIPTPVPIPVPIPIP